MIRTIETDPDSPFQAPEVPAAEWTYRWALDDALRRGWQYARAWLAKSGRTEPAPWPQAMSLERTIVAYINHGRWVWDCPICVNAGRLVSYVGSIVDPRAFCVVCFNDGDGYWPIAYPDDRAAIETLLDRRPEDARNWHTGESVELLQAENLAHGIAYDVDGYPWIGADEGLALARAYLEQTAIDAAERRAELEAGNVVD